MPVEELPVHREELELEPNGVVVDANAAKNNNLVI